VAPAPRRDPANAIAVHAPNAHCVSDQQTTVFINRHISETRERGLWPWPTISYISAWRHKEDRAAVTGDGPDFAVPADATSPVPAHFRNVQIAVSIDREAGARG
jgi:hypothetical protein